MRSILIAAAAAVGFAGTALAEGPTLLSDDQMDQVVAGKTMHLWVDGSGFYILSKDSSKVPEEPPTSGEWTSVTDVECGSPGNNGCGDIWLTYQEWQEPVL